MFTDDIIIDDDVISDNLQTEITDVIKGRFFTWFTCDDPELTGDQDSYNNFKSVTSNVFEAPQMVHTFVHEGEVNSSAADTALVMLDKVCEKYKIKERAHRIKVNLCQKVWCDNNDAHQTPHVDFREPHWTMIYYVDDSDGDTFIFDQRAYRNCEYDEIKELTLKQRVSPKKGRCLIFRGDQFHAGMHPRNHTFRTVINFNFIIDGKIEDEPN